MTDKRDSVNLADFGNEFTMVLVSAAGDGYQKSLTLHVQLATNRVCYTVTNYGKMILDTRKLQEAVEKFNNI